MGNVIDLERRIKLKAVNESIRELDEVAALLKSTIKSLTKYDKYASVKRRLDDLFMLYQDIKRAKEKKLELITRLENEKRMVEDGD